MEKLVVAVPLTFFLYSVSWVIWNIGIVPETALLIALCGLAAYLLQAVLVLVSMLFCAVCYVCRS